MGWMKYLFSPFCGDRSFAQKGRAGWRDRIHAWMVQNVVTNTKNNLALLNSSLIIYEHVQFVNRFWEFWATVANHSDLQISVSSFNQAAPYTAFGDVLCIMLIYHKTFWYTFYLRWILTTFVNICLPLLFASRRFYFIFILLYYFLRLFDRTRLFEFAVINHG